MCKVRQEVAAKQQTTYFQTAHLALWHGCLRPNPDFGSWCVYLFDLGRIQHDRAAGRCDKGAPPSTARLVLWWKLTALVLSEMPILMPNCESWANQTPMV